MRSITINPIVAICLAAVILSSIAGGKTVDLAQDFTSESTWKNYDIAVYRVVEVDASPAIAVLDRSQQFTPWPLGGQIKVAAANLFASQGQAQAVQTGDAILLTSRRNDRILSGLALVLKPPIEKAPLVVALSEISVMRAGTGRKRFEDGLTAKSDLATRYALRQLSDSRDYLPPTDVLKRIQQVRDAVSASFPTRLLANALVSRGSPADAKEWAKKILEEKQGLIVDQSAVINQLQVLLPTYAERFGYFTAIIDDGAVPVGGRVMCVGAVARTCFDESAPTGKDSSNAFSLLVRLLNSPEPLLRESAASMLYNVCSRVHGVSVRRTLAEQAAKATDAATARVQDQEVRAYLGAYRQLLHGLEDEPGDGTGPGSGTRPMK